MIPPKNVKFEDKKAEKSLHELMEDIYGRLGGLSSQLSTTNQRIEGLQSATPIDTSHFLTLEELNVIIGAGSSYDPAAAGFHNRGDPTDEDWETGDLTIDSGYHDLDCSAIVPALAKAILFRVTIRDGSVGTYARFRRKGNANAFADHIMYTQVANNYTSQCLIVPCSTGRVIEYLFETGMDNYFIVIIGWFF
jgi:hypothetical protein